MSNTNVNVTGAPFVDDSNVSKSGVTTDEACSFTQIGGGGSGSVSVSTDAPSSVTTTDATLEGTLDSLGGSSSVSVSFEYRENGVSSWTSTSSSSQSSTGSFSEQVGGLTADTTYEYRAVADAETGTTVSFTTDTDTSSSLVAEADTVALTPSQWTSVSLSKSFTDPIVVAKPASYAGSDPVHARLRNVSSGGFEITLEEWDYQDGTHATETVTYLVVERGTFASSDGSLVETGTVSTDEATATVALGGDFSAAPLVFTQPQTENDALPVVTRNDNVTSSGFETELQTELGVNAHGTETVGYIAVEDGLTDLDGIAVETGNTGNNVSDDWYSVGFQSAPSSPGLLADMQTANGGDPCTLRHRNLDSSGVELQVDEEQSGDTEVAHGSETVGYLALDGSGTQTPTESFAEVGSETTDQATSTTRHSVSLAQSYDNPVVIMNPASYNDSEPVHPRVRDVTSTGFDFELEKWDYTAGNHGTETVGYAVFEEGQHTTDDGTKIEVGTTTTTDSWTSVSLSQSFGTTPIVFTQSMTFNGGAPIVTRNRNVTTSGFDVRVQEEMALGGHSVETIGYVAIEPGTTSINGTAMEVGDTGLSVSDDWYAIGFTDSFGSPTFLADGQTTNGGETAGIRYRDLTGSGAEVFMEEEQSEDTETSHANENVGYWVFEGTGTL
ncbi:hypothetical protein [Halomarina rubra]|uniref:Fibronectin type-III domain-containing protein n=1 Tax=Halomarina rubra TaxID=2071873 RepID=A0ABD6AT14_9EURY|nr:hypothetical protein [Halomarina rubra]